MPDLDHGLLKRVAQRLSEPPLYATDSEQQSILALAASAYSSGLNSEVDDEEQTRPTGFDPQAAALFEAVVESAFLVAHADGEFDPDERLAFKRVVAAACQGKVSESQVDALIADFEDQLKEDGMVKRIEMVSRIITRPEQGGEILRIAGLLAAVSAGVNERERDVLERLAVQFGLGNEALEAALAEVDRAMQG